MRFILLIAGFFAAIFLIPLFMDLWEGLILPLTISIEDPHLQAFFTAIPYIWIVVIVIAAFFVLRGRREA